jgi:hypothetical protein
MPWQHAASLADTGMHAPARSYLCMTFFDLVPRMAVHLLLVRSPALRRLDPLREAVDCDR